MTLVNDLHLYMYNELFCYFEHIVNCVKVYKTKLYDTILRGSVFLSFCSKNQTEMNMSV